MLFISKQAGKVVIASLDEGEPVIPVCLDVIYQHLALHARN